jgi:hypothetical protein
MSKNVSINNVDYIIPEIGNSDWGEYTTDLLEALVDGVNSAFGPNDIRETTAPVVNNTTNGLVPGLAFDPASVRGAFIEYTVIRTDSTSAEFIETGVLYLSYKSDASTNEKWQIKRDANDDIGYDFSMADSGQMFYNSTDLGLGSLDGTITFRSRAILS